MAKKKTSKRRLEALLVIIIINGASLVSSYFLYELAAAKLSFCQALLIVYVLEVNAFLLLRIFPAGKLQIPPMSEEKKTVSVTLVMPLTAMDRIDKMTIENESNDRNTVFRRALALYQLALSAKQDGGRLFLRRWGRTQEIEVT